MAIPADIPRGVESMMVYFFYVTGSVSLVVNTVTLLIIARKSVALDREVKFLAKLQQCSCLIMNAFVTLLFIPFFYFRMGGGYCMGVLCLVVPYQHLMVVAVFLLAVVISAFGMMIIVRHQLLLPEDSFLRMRTAGRYVAYVILNCVIHLWTVFVVLTLPSDRRSQNRVLDEIVQIRWRERELNWFLFYGPGLPTAMRLSKYFAFVFAPALCIFIILPFAHMLIIVLR
ncbi:hypothetical protein PMAYCL1PPCAC_14869, partial [Pristionchus mayeri]